MATRIHFYLNLEGRDDKNTPSLVWTEDRIISFVPTMGMTLRFPRCSDFEVRKIIVFPSLNLMAVHCWCSFDDFCQAKISGQWRPDSIGSWLPEDEEAIRSKVLELREREAQGKPSLRHA